MRFPSPQRLGFAPRLAALYAGLFTLNGIQMPFFPVWLKAKGLEPRMIGLLLAVPMVVRVFAIPLATRTADRHDALRAAIVLASWLTVAGYTAVGLVDGVGAIFIAYALASLALTPVMPLAETYALKGLAARGRAYGPVRLWGSLTFILGTFCAGFAIDLIPARHLIWLMVAASMLTAFLSLALEPMVTPHPAANEQVARPHLLRDSAFIAVLAAAGLIQASHALFYGFSALQWSALGFDGTAIAGLWALGVIAEIVLFALHGRLPPFVQPLTLLMIGGAGAALRWVAMAFDPPSALLPWLQVLHALSFGATHLGALGFVARHAPPGQSATAQGYLAIALGLAMAGATSLSGWLYGAFGGRAYAAMALAAIVGGACGYVAQRAHRAGVARP
jgi:PPP family 3-phenylpropionic acid transporter